MQNAVTFKVRMHAQLITPCCMGEETPSLLLRPHMEHVPDKLADNQLHAIAPMEPNLTPRFRSTYACTFMVLWQYSQIS